MHCVWNGLSWVVSLLLCRTLVLKFAFQMLREVTGLFDDIQARKTHSPGSSPEAAHRWFWLMFLYFPLWLNVHCSGFFLLLERQSSRGTERQIFSLKCLQKRAGLAGLKPRSSHVAGTLVPGPPSAASPVCSLAQSRDSRSSRGGCQHPRHWLNLLCHSACPCLFVCCCCC